MHVPRANSFEKCGTLLRSKASETTLVYILVVFGPTSSIFNTQITILAQLTIFLYKKWKIYGKDPINKVTADTKS